MNATKPATLWMRLLDASASSVVEALTTAGYDVSFADDERATGGMIVRAGSSHVEHTEASPAPDRAPLAIVPSPPESSVVASEARAREVQLRLGEKLDAVAQLAAGIAHELNNVLSVVSVCADEMAERIDPTDQECLSQIRDAIERGSRLTRDLLAFSRRDIESARVVSLDELVAAAKPMLSRILGESVALTTELDAGGSIVRVDPGQWSSVLANLAANARAAMPDGGTTIITTRALTMDPTSRGRDKPMGRYVELTVTDTGCGIPDDVQPRVFDPFFTTKALGQGAGLGLSVVHGIVERSGGWLELVSGVNRGTTLRIYVPLASDAASIDADRPRSPASPPRGASVLVVEDEHGLRRIAARALSRRGYRVFQAASGEEALAMLDEVGTIDALVTDIVLPGMNGRRFATVLRERYPDAAVLYTSGHTNDDELRRGVSRAELAFLQKPYTTSALLERVQEVLERARGGHLRRAL